MHPRRRRSRDVPVADSPAPHPIEAGWAKLKQLLKQLEALTAATLDATIARAVEQITLGDDRGWFTRFGRRAQPE